MAVDEFGEMTPGVATPGATNVPAPATESAGEAEALALGITDALIKMFPELGPIRDLFRAKRYGDARTAFYNSDYYKNLTGTAVDRQRKKATQPGVYAQEFDAWKQAQIVRLTGKGVRITPDIEGMFETFYDKGYTDLQVDVKILDSGKLGPIGGSVLGKVNTLKDFAYDQGVNNLINQSWWNKKSESLFAGTTTEEDIEEELKGIAASAFPAYSEGIKAGRSFGMQTSALRQMLANTYEVDVDTIDNNNPVFKELVGYVNPQTKKPEIVPLWEAEKIAKSKDQWLYTKNARDTFDGLALKVLRDWGLA